MNPNAGFTTIRVLIVDDEALMRAGLRLMVDGTNGICVVGEAADGGEVPAAVRQFDPDVILMDIRMPMVDGIGATTALRRSGSRASVIILTAFDTDALLRDALLGGAVSFLLKDSKSDVVIQPIHDAAAGRSSFSPRTLSRLVAMATQRQGSTLAPTKPRESGDSLFLSTTTVKTHLASLFSKLHITNRVQLAIRMLEDDHHAGRPR